MEGKDYEYEDNDSDNYKLIGAGPKTELYITLAIPVIPFYYPGENTSYDKAYDSGYLGNFYKLDREIMLCYCKDELNSLYEEIKKDPRHSEMTDKEFNNMILTKANTDESGFLKLFNIYKFNNVEAAFQAAKYIPSEASKFTAFTGAEAVAKIKTDQKKDRPGYKYIILLYRDEHGKYSFPYDNNKNIVNNYTIMKYLLKQKFKDKKLADKLMETSGKFLLEHKRSLNPDPKKAEKTWSDNNDGTGENWLGFLLMFLRFELLLSKKDKDKQKDNLEHIINKFFNKKWDLHHTLKRTDKIIKNLIVTLAQQINYDYPERNDPSVKANGKGKGKKQPQGQPQAQPKGQPQAQPKGQPQGQPQGPYKGKGKGKG